MLSDQCVVLACQHYLGSDVLDPILQLLFLLFENIVVLIDLPPQNFFLAEAEHLHLLLVGYPELPLVIEDPTGTLQDME